MAPRFKFALLFLSVGSLIACAGATHPADDANDRAASTTLAPPSSAESLPLMCALTRPNDVISSWTRDPTIRRGRISADLTKTITDEELALDASFDGYRIGEIDHIWSFNTPDEQVALDSPLSLDVTSNDAGFTVRFQRGRRGALKESEGCEDCFEFIPDSPVWQYTFEFRNGCWELTVYDVVSEENE